MSNLLFIEKIGEFFTDFLPDTVLSIFTFIPKIIYFLVACLISIVDMFQVLFRKIAGLDPIMIGEDVVVGDSAYKLITDALFTNEYPAIQLIFWSLIILGIFMIIVTSIIATIRLEYNPDKEKGNSKSKIIGNFLKALFSLAIVPIASIFGMFLCNTLVQGVDTIMTSNVVSSNEAYQYFDQWNSADLDNNSVDKDRKASYVSYDIFGINIPSTMEPFSGTVFKASAYSCNRFRKYGVEYLQQVNASGTKLGIFGEGKVNEPKVAADIIDTAFAINAKYKGGTQTLSANGIDSDYYSPGWFAFFGSTTDSSFSKYNVEQVFYFYDLWTFNYIIAFASLIVLGKMYSNFCIGLMGRIFEILALFIFAPIAIGVMPSDGGAALGRWRTNYMAKYALAFFMIFGMNMVAPLVTITQSIKFFGLPILDYIINTIVIIAALNAVNSLTTTFASVLLDKAGKAAYEGSMKAAEGVTGALGKSVGATMSAAKLASLPARAGIKYGAKGVGLAVHGVDSAVRHYGSRERGEIRDSLQYNQARDQQRYKDMNKDQRKDMADAFLNSAEGQAMVAGSYGGDVNAARKAILDDRRQQGAVNLGDKLSDADRDAVSKFNMEYQNFNKTDDAKKYAKGSADYNNAMDRYMASTEKEKVKTHMKSAETLNAQQADIRRKRENWKEGIERRKESRAKFAGKVSRGAQRVAKPLVRPLAELINLVPGVSFFSRPQK